MLKLEDKLYTSSEVAQILGVSLRSVYRYIEENKLDAEVKTATGRHRFTKKNILDFLYPNGDNYSEPTNIQATQKISKPVEKKPLYTTFDFDEDDDNDDDFTFSAPVIKREKVEQKPIMQKSIPTFEDEDADVMEEPVLTAAPAQQAESVEEEEIDWLAKFRAAARKFEDDTADTIVAPVTTAEPKLVYYRSALGGLREIAQNLDKTARSSGTDYAFTLNSGLSLFKPIKPFALLHSYVRPDDRHLFESMLKLQSSTQDTAQLCLILSDNADIYADASEMHGLYVVSKAQLSKDIAKFGDSALKEEADSIL